MTTFVSKEVQAGMDAARKAAMLRKSRLRVETGEQSHRVLRLWETGFALDADVVDHLRGLVDVYDGGRHLCQALVIASEEENGELICNFKRSTEALDRAPLDFARDENAPIALLGSG